MPLIITPGQLERRAEFYYQLAQLTSAGLTLINSLEHLNRNPPSFSYRVHIRHLLDDLKSGFTFTESLNRQKGWLPAFDVALLHAGEHSGRLDSCFRLLSNHYQDRARLARQMIGDLAYPDGSALNFTCYDRTWGKEKSRTRPAPGNHEFHSDGATYYFQYFGAAAGEASKGYYSYELGSWHIVVLNSECDQVGGCGAGSAQEKWLREDLAAHPVACTLAYFHKPLFSSGGQHGNDLTVKPLWDALYRGGADVVVSGHDHDYERFAPQTPEAKADAARGIREFVAGTGGKNHRRFELLAHANSEVRNADTFGVLKLTLRPGKYAWEFMPVDGGTFRDSGEGTCH